MMGFFRTSWRRAFSPGDPEEAKRHPNAVILAGVLVLGCAGLLGIHTARSAYGASVAARSVQRQLLWLVVGTGAFLGVSRSDYRRWRDSTPAFYALTLLLLVGVLLAGPRIMGARRWIVLCGISLQPAELAKASTIAMLAWWVWYCGESARRDELILVGGAMLAGFPLFLIYCEPALGTTLTLTFSLFVLTCTVGLTWRGLVLLVCLCALLLVFTFDVYHVTACFRPVEHSFPRWILHRALKPYQLRRIRGHRVRSDTDIFAGGNNEVQALITLGRGGLVGHGPDEAHQVVEGYLPRQVSHNDFIICTLAEIGGFCVSGGVLLLEWALVLWCLHVGYACGDRFGRGVCIGVGAVFFVHAVIPLAVALRICPVTGLPIYFVSAGGSALLGAMACLGMVQSVASHRGHPASACRDRLREVAELDTIREFSIVIMGVRFRLIYAH